MTLHRRDFLLAGAAGLAGLVRPAWAGKGRACPRVVVVGAGYGGASFARHLKLWAPQAHVTVVEPQPDFVSCPYSNTVVGGLNRLQDITFPYTWLKAAVDRFVADRVDGVDPRRRTVHTVGGLTLPYDRLVLSAGVELMFDRVAGYDAAAQRTIKHAWKAGPDQTGVLRRQLEAMPDGGVFVITIPVQPFRCPPAPYERASLVANYFRRAKPRSKIIILDGNPDIVSKKALFLAAWKKHYGYGTDASLIDYRPNSLVVSVDAKAMRVATEFDEAQGDVINLVPPMRAAAVTHLAGARTGEDGTWCPVDYHTCESTEVPNVHILGDSISSNLSKAGALANNTGKLCASALADIFRGRAPDPAPVLTSTCYSATTDRHAVHVATVFRYNPKENLMEVQPGSGLSEAESEAEFSFMGGWARNIWADTLGLPMGYRFTNRV
ncbi:MAG TPA: NAD(P)/FAD-dependent oxidoreductase [Thiobacillaceae bacterium]|nr:NAD(P)/FAD-dependent oxidoreductase [Thiobacillaceae bacterium]